jgi:hypothetical protein
MDMAKKWTTSDLRSLSVRDLVHALHFDTGDGSFIRDEINRRCLDAKVTSIYDLCIADFAKGKLQTSETSASKTNGTLRDELTEIANSRWDMKGMEDIERVREFCSEEGDVLDCTEEELSPRQKRFLKVIRNEFGRWQRRGGRHAR